MKLHYGWVNAPQPGPGWWGGWVEREGGIYSFALDLGIREAADAPRREALGRAALQLLGIRP
ncbi:MAG: hypothetical protein DIU74_004285 [Pseudomonadota bacterium]|nr:MAG: hypothetical protein DIU74_00895 [Pseudomonadota bacterium]